MRMTRWDKKRAVRVSTGGLESSPTAAESAPRFASPLRRACNPNRQINGRSKQIGLRHTYLRFGYTTFQPAHEQVDVRTLMPTRSPPSLS